MIKEYRPIIIALIAGICAILCVFIGVSGLARLKNGPKSSGILATGSASKDFVSDLIVWRGNYSVHGDTPQDAYGTIKRNEEMVRKYLSDNGVADSEVVFDSIQIIKKTKDVYNASGKMVDRQPDGYDLSQQFNVTSKDVDKIESISRDISKLIDSGVELTSQPPEYYYTKLDELKLELIKEATQNAKARIDILADQSGAKAGRLLSANLGVFQITGQNSASEEYTYGGAFNTKAKDKTASITVKLNYEVK